MTRITATEENRDLIAHIKQQVDQNPNLKESVQPNTTTQGNPRPKSESTVAQK
jgi:hypothetical protein